MLKRTSRTGSSRIVCTELGSLDKIVESDSEMDEDNEETESPSDSDFSPDADEEMDEA